MGYLWFDIYVDVRKYGWEGFFKMQNEEWKAVLRKGDEKRRSEGGGALQNCDNSEQLELWVDGFDFKYGL